MLVGGGLQDMLTTINEEVPVDSRNGKYKNKVMRNFLVAITVILLLACSGPLPQTDADRQPNFLILLVDDLGWKDFGCTGSDFYQTPNIDQLAADGVRFTQSYAACTVCSPTRAALQTGLYPARTHVTDFIAGQVRPKAKLKVPDWNMKLDHEHKTIAEVLKDSGYRTAHVGKWHLMPRLQPDVMQDYSPEHHGYDRNIGGNEWGAPGSYFHPYERNGRYVAPLPEGGQEGDYLTDVLTDEALMILEDYKDEPFLLNFSYYTVHTPIEAKEEDIALFTDKVDSKKLHRDPVYAAMLASLDRSVGRLRAKLEELGIADNTVMILTGDNGGLDRKGPDGRMGNPTENYPLRAGKGSVYEGGVRTPTVYYWPGVTPGGALIEEPVITMDIYPTILEIAGIEGDPTHNENLDGVSLVKILQDPTAKMARETLYWHYPHYHAGGATPYSAIRDGGWRLVEFYEDRRVELFNLTQDIGEEHDLAKAMPEKARELSDKLHAWRAAVGAQDPVPNPDYVADNNR